MNSRGSVHAIPLALLCGFACFLLWDCSSTGKISGFFTSWRSKAPVSRPDDREIAGFASTVRPYQGNADAHYNLARYLLETGRYKEAIVEFKKVAALRPESAPAYNGLGVCYDNLREFEKAINSYEMALKLDTNLDYVHNNMGYSLLLQKRYTEAIDAFKKAIALNDRQHQYHNNLGRAYALAGRFDLAMDEFELAARKPVTQAAAAEQGEQAPAQRTALNGQEQRAAGTSHSVGNPPKNSRVELLNGNGINGMARKMRTYLKERGFKVVRCANADSFDYPRTNIYYKKEAQDTAVQLARHIPNVKNVTEVNKLDRPGVVIKVLVGKDLWRYRKHFEGGRT